MCHIAVELISKKNEKNPHGPEWQRWEKKCNEEMPKIYNKPVEKIQKFSEPDELTEEDM